MPGGRALRVTPVGLIHSKYCEDFIGPTGCPRGIACPKKHDIQKCTCGLVLRKVTWSRHTGGNRHRVLLEEQEKLKVLELQAAISEEKDALEKRRCDRCRQTIPVEAFPTHLEYHESRDQRNAYNATIAQAELDKEGITVSGKDGGVDFGILDTETSVEITITIENTTQEYAFFLHTCKMRLSSTGEDTRNGVRFSARLKGSSTVVRPSSTRTVLVSFHPSHAGQYEDTLELVFWHLDLKRTFLITRSVKAVVGSRQDHEDIQATAPYTGPRQVPRLDPDGCRIIESTRPPTWSKTIWRGRLPEYNVPEGIKDFLNAVLSGRKEDASKGMPSAFNLRTYAQSWQPLLHMEEEQVRQDLDAYALEGVGIDKIKNSTKYRLKIPGLAENRPSVLVGDHILASRSGSSGDLAKRTWYEGRVHEVRQHDVTLGFGESDFSVYRGTKFDVRFVLNRIPFRRMHHALANRNDQGRILFPSERHISGVKRVTERQQRSVIPFNRKVGEDEEQLETVTTILNQKPGSVPFVVFGPPGTGKTVTIVEAMYQLLDKDPSIRILACAPSNSAADLLAQRLSDHGPSVVFRLNALTRKYNDLPENLREFSCINEDKVFAIPPIEEILEFRVVVATCLSGGSPAGMGMKRGHFTHIFIDEAGQGKEPEVVLPIKSLADAKTNIILAGDNQQLGPTVHSQMAGSMGLKTSFLSRIMDRDIYNLDSGARGLTIIKLVKNFRSHPAILDFPNKTFYAGELEPCGNPVLTRSLERIEELPKKAFPLIFHGIVGKDNREASSPSFFNVDEASLVKMYCRMLLENRKYGLKADHIGVITPYHAQRCKISDLLRREDCLGGIKVGSVEEFQGQERRVIVMSTVRSNTDYVTSDIRRSLGFVANSRRMNVAITRAQALLIVIGNPLVLSLDPLWRSFMNYVHSGGGWKGKEIDWNPVEPIGSAEQLGTARRMQAQSEMEDTMAKIRATIMQVHEDSDFEFDLEGSDDEDAVRMFERPILREAE